MSENPNLNEMFELDFADADVITVPIDETLTHSGEAADAAAVGAALDLKADKSQIATIDVNGEGADNQGHIILTGEHIPMSGSDTTTVRQAVTAAAGRTGADIPLNTEQGAVTIAEAVQAIDASNATTIPMAEGSTTMISQKILAMDSVANANTAAIDALQQKTAETILVEEENEKTVKEALDERVQKVNGIAPDQYGNVQVSSVPMASNLESSMSQHTIATYVARASGGEASIENGGAWLMDVKGNSVHSGFSPEVLEMSVVETGEAGHITAALDRDTFVSYVEESGTITFAYTTEWTLNGDSVDLGDYGVTVSGEPVSGDLIVINYTAEVRGVIVNAMPEAFVSTGWNLYSNATGYARVVRYSDDYGFGISGTYASLKYSATLEGTKSDITVTSGNFAVPGDGYVWVTGGNSTDTAIWMTHGDWTEGYEGGFAAYTASEISLSSVMTNYFPYGLLKVGTTADEINLNIGLATSRVDYMAYSIENLEAARATGREYAYDQTMIYLARAEAQTYSITALDGGYTANDHGMEFFDGTEVGVTAETLYGNNLKNKLERDVLTISQQALSAAQQSQVQSNLGLTPTTALDVTTAGYVADARAAASLKGSIDTLNSNTDYRLLSASKTDVTINANSMAVVTFVVNVPDGYRIVGAYDDSYYANVIGVPIRINTGSGSVNVIFNYFATAGMTHDFFIKALALRNVTVT